MNYAATRARATDSDTSHEAAKNAVTKKASNERLAIRLELLKGPATAREIATATGMDYITVQRRISEVGGIVKTDMSRDGCRVWATA